MKHKYEPCEKCLAQDLGDYCRVCGLAPEDHSEEEDPANGTRASLS
jgi:hypothetical protein